MRVRCWRCVWTLSPLHNSCGHAACYGAISQNLTAHKLAYVDERKCNQSVVCDFPSTVPKLYLATLFIFAASQSPYWLSMMARAALSESGSRSSEPTFSHIVSPFQETSFCVFSHMNCFMAVSILIRASPYAQHQSTFYFLLLLRTQVWMSATISSEFVSVGDGPVNRSACCLIPVDALRDICLCVFQSGQRALHVFRLFFFFFVFF